jgi:hypothetical protein
MAKPTTRKTGAGRTARPVLESNPSPAPHEGMDAESLKTGILRHLEFTLGELPRPNSRNGGRARVPP